MTGKIQNCQLKSKKHQIKKKKFNKSKTNDKNDTMYCVLYTYIHFFFYYVLVAVKDSFSRCVSYLGKIIQDLNVKKADIIHQKIQSLWAILWHFEDPVCYSSSASNVMQRVGYSADQTAALQYY